MRNLMHSIGITKEKIQARQYLAVDDINNLLKLEYAHQTRNTSTPKRHRMSQSRANNIQERDA